MAFSGHRRFPSLPQENFFAINGEQDKNAERRAGPDLFFSGGAEPLSIHGF
jgi:hypothetical protein